MEIMKLSALIALYVVGTIIAVKMEKLRFGTLLILCVFSVIIAVKIIF